MKRLGEWLLVALALAVGAGSCSDGGTGPVAGLLTVSPCDSQPRRGRLRFCSACQGPGALTSVTAGPGLQVFAQPLSTLTRVAVTGTLTNGAVVTIGVADTRKAAQYAATVQDVAALDFQLRALARYSLTVSPVASQSLYVVPPPGAPSRRPQLATWATHAGRAANARAPAAGRHGRRSSTAGDCEATEKP